MGKINSMNTIKDISTTEMASISIPNNLYLTENDINKPVIYKDEVIGHISYVDKDKIICNIFGSWNKIIFGTTGDVASISFERRL